MTLFTFFSLFFLLHFVMFNVVDQQKLVHEFKVERNLISVASISPAPHQIKSASVIVLSSDSTLDSGLDFD